MDDLQAGRKSYQGNDPEDHPQNLVPIYKGLF